MKHSKRQSSDPAEQDMAHLRQLRPDPGAGVAPGSAAGGWPAPGGGMDAVSPSVAAGPAGSASVAAPPASDPTGPTGRAGGDPAAGAGNYGRPLFSEIDPETVPRAPGAPAAPVASSAPPGAVVGPAGPLTDLPIPPAMQYPAGPPLGPVPGQARPEVFGGNGMAAATAVLAPPMGDHGSVTGEWITCPECGESQAIDPAQRRSEDFCHRCDFPLFWARAAVVPLSTDETGASLRRLPGTVGRAATASVACPHCGEPNSPTAIICIRCSQPMMLAQPAPEPELEPVYVPPPPEPEPEPGFPLGWVIAACVALLVITVLVAWIALAV
jgi:hypothetical protein